MKKSYLRLIAITLMIAMMACFIPGRAHAQDNPLSLMPESAQAALFLPSVDFLEKQGSPVLAVPGVKEKVDIGAILGDLPSKLGVANAKNLAEVFKAAGLDSSKPLAAFVATKDGAQSLAGALPIADAKIATEKMKLIFSSKPEEITVGDAKGLFSKSEELGYSIQGNYVFIGSTPEMIAQVAAKVKNPVSLAYMKGDKPQEVAVVTSIDRLLSTGLISAPAGNAQALEPAVAYLKSFIDEIVLGIGEQNGEAYVRVGAHDPSGKVAPPASPLKLHALFGGGAPVMVDLRNNPALFEKTRMLMMSNPALAKVGTYVMLASQILGDELAVAITGVNGNIPDGIVAATLAKPESINGLLGLAGIDTKAGPKYQQNGANVFVKENVTDGLNLYIALAGNLLVLSTNEAKLKTALDNLNPDGTVKATTAIDAKLIAAAPNGFVVIDPSKLDQAQLASLPSEVSDLKDKKIIATLGNNAEWRELRIAVPGGIGGVADAVKTVVK